MKSFLYASFLAFVSFNSPVLARDILHFSANQLQESVPKLQVWNGSGLNINLCQTGQFIQKAWLDDPSRLTVDFSPPMNTGTTCVIHLRRIKPLNFEVLPQTPQTLLTLATNQTVYQFVILYGQGSPQYYAVRVTTGNQKRELPVDWGIRLRRGLAEAQKQGLISQEQGNIVLIGRVNRFIAQVEQGQSFEDAAISNNVSLPFIQRLQELGTVVESQYCSDNKNLGVEKQRRQGMQREQGEKNLFQILKIEEDFLLCFSSSSAPSAPSKQGLILTEQYWVESDSTDVIESEENEVNETETEAEEISFLGNL